MLKVELAAVASQRFVLPVMCESIYALAPLVTLQASSFRSHPSEPYTKMLQHAAMYSRSFRDSGKSAAHMCLRLPARTFARSHFERTSGIISPSVWKIEPRYGNCRQLSTSSSPHRTFGNLSCCSSSFASLISRFSVRLARCLCHLCLFRRMCVFSLCCNE